MSVFVNLQSIKHTLTNRVQTPKFILDQNTINVKEIAISVEYIAKPATEACCTNQADWVITKDVYSIAVQAENDRIVSSSIQQQEERRTFYKESKFKSFLHKTPIDVLFSESKSQDQETQNKLARLPLYSSECKINILVYPIQNQNDKFGLEGSRILLKPESRIQLGRDQLIEMIRDLKSKMQGSRLSYSRFQRPNQIELVRKFDNYQIIVKKIVKNGEDFYESRNSLLNKQSYQNYSCNLQQQVKINRRFHLIQFCFVLSVQKFQECAGYLRAGFAKKVNFGESNVRFSYNNNEKPATERLNNVSQYSIEDRKQRNFNFNLDFSGINTKAHSRATQKLQKTRKRKQIQKPAQKQRNNSFFDWLCCNSSKNVNNDGEVQVNNSEQVLSMNSNQFQQEQAKRLASLKRVDLYLGPCKTNNLFSALDKGSHSQNFSMIEKHY